MKMASLIAAAIAAILLNLLSTEVRDVLTAFSSWMVRRAASRLPRMSERMAEQWQADLEARHGIVSQLCFGFSLLWNLPNVSEVLPENDDDNESVNVAAVGSAHGFASSAASPPPSTRGIDLHLKPGVVQVYGVPPSSITLYSLSAEEAARRSSASLSFVGSTPHVLVRRIESDGDGE